MIQLFISGPEIILVLFVVVMIFGTDKLPEMARGLGKGMRQLKDATNDIKAEVTRSGEQGDEVKKHTTKDVLKEINQVKEDFKEITGPIKRNFDV